MQVRLIYLKARLYFIEIAFLKICSIIAFNLSLLSDKFELKRLEMGRFFKCIFHTIQ